MIDQKIDGWMTKYDQFRGPSGSATAGRPPSPKVGQWGGHLKRSKGILTGNDGLNVGTPRHAVWPPI